jgi:hypothetical protein
MMHLLFMMQQIFTFPLTMIYLRCFPELISSKAVGEELVEVEASGSTACEEKAAKAVVLGILTTRCFEGPWGS